MVYTELVDMWTAGLSSDNYGCTFCTDAILAIHTTGI